VLALREVNEKFSKSRYASPEKVDELELRRQTVLSGQLLARAAEIERELAAALRRRQNSAASEKLAAATAIVEKVSAEYPRSRSLDPTMRRKLAYLTLRVADLDALQEQVFSRLAPVSGVKGLQMLKTEVTQDLYQRVMNANPSQNVGRGLPVDSVSWTDAQEFCERLSWLLGLRVRLPSELEFRAVWRPGDAGTWSADNSGGRSREVGKSPAAESGFFDLAGNLAEWLQPANEKGETAPVVVGSFADPADVLQSLKIVPTEKRERDRLVGFRFVVEGSVN
jgi:hypothetical protein